MTLDLTLLKGGHVIDPSQDLDGVFDIAIQNNRIARIGFDLQSDEPQTHVIDLHGKYVCPGLIDLHGHWYEGSSFGIDPHVCLNHGVTTVVDAGTTGYVNFPEFRRSLINDAHIQVLAFVHIAALGVPTSLVGELEDLRYARPEETAAVIEENRDVVLGVKIREGTMTGNAALQALDLALGAAERTKLPLMVHISKTAPTRTILSRLRPGDIVTHCFQGRGDGILDQLGGLLPEVVQARADGVVFDVGHGCGSFSWDTARRAFEHSFFPDSISTDLHRLCVERWAIDMPTTMSKFLHLGMSLNDVILKSTWVPSKAISRDDQIGTLRQGTIADIFVFEIEEGEFALEDTHLRVETARRFIKPFLVFRNGKVIEPGSFQTKLRKLYKADQEVFGFVEITA